MNKIQLPKISTKPEICESHGGYESRNLFGAVWSRCPTCEADRKAADDAKKAEEDRQERANRWARTVDCSGIPKRFKSRTLDTFVADSEGKKRAHGFAVKYASEFTTGAAESGKSALFVGKPGTGKTHLAAGIGLSAMASGHSVLFYTVMRAIRRVKDTWARGSEEKETDAVNALVLPDLLILDEVGVQFGSETEKNILFDVLNARYEQCKPCILLSNHSVDDVRAFLGERVFERLREDGGQVIAFDWDSMRGRL